VAWLVLLVIGYRGIAAIIEGTPVSAPSAGPAVSTTGTFPRTQAEAYALQFGNAYLNFSPATANRRARLLSAFVAPGTDSQLGWNGAGTQTLQNEQVFAIRVTGGHTAIVTLLAQIDQSRMVELGVPVYAPSSGRMVVSGEPALLPAPGQAVAPGAQASDSDQVAVTQLMAQLPPFFRAYASGGQATLSRFLTSGAQVTGLGGDVTLGSVQSVAAPFGGATRNITAVVIWQVKSGRTTPSSSAVGTAPASLEMTYRMTVVRQGKSWYVQSIGASTQSPGPP
jgi:hypothetical protein